MARSYSRGRQKLIIRRAARRAHIPARILWGVFGTETNFGKNKSVSSAGAQGPFQFMPATARGFHIDPHDFKQAAYAAAKYLGGYKRRGLAGMLSAYNAGPAGGSQPEYVREVRRLARTWKGAGARDAVSRSGGTRGGGAAGDPPAAVEPGGTGLAALLAELESKQAAPPQSPLTAPSFSASQRVPLPAGYRSLPDNPAPAPKQSLSDLIRMASELKGPEPPAPTEVAAGGTRGRGRSHGVLHRGGYPLSRRGKLIGFPYQGTHTLGNWQSDNAVDIAVPVGTPVLATEDGTITKTGGQKGTSGRFAGFSITLGGKRDSYFFTHLSRRTVKVGQRVRRGQIIGYSGSANGVAHLHIGREHGHPARAYG